MEAAPEAVDPYPDDPAADRQRPALRVPRRPLSRIRVRALPADLRRELLWVTVLYIVARIVLVLAAVLIDSFGHRPLQAELANWDGVWYRAIANHGYPHHQAPFAQTTLGFFPLFPVAIYLVSPILQFLFGAGPVWAATYAGVLISAVGGLIATMFVHRLAEGWWDRATARRATVIFVFFPGAVVFSMVYSEGLLLPLAAVCVWALERRRWVLAGTMAGLGTADNAIGLVLCVVCGVCALHELWRHGPRSRAFAMSALATAMSTAGAIAFAAYLWAWTGNPFANYVAQRDGWNRKTDVFALIRQVGHTLAPFDPSHLNHPEINLNDVVGELCVLVLLWLLWLLWRSRRDLSLPAIVWSLGITYFMVTSEFVPPNPRLLITAFPLLVLPARWVSARRFPRLVAWTAGLFVLLSLLTFTYHLLRP